MRFLFAAQANLFSGHAPEKAKPAEHNRAPKNGVGAAVQSVRKTPSRCDNSKQTRKAAVDHFIIWGDLPAPLPNPAAGFFLHQRFGRFGFLGSAAKTSCQGSARHRLCYLKGGLLDSPF